MVIVCACESPLGQPQGDLVHCTRCPRTYPTKETVQILKLLRLAAREMDNDGKPANENVRHVALNKAAKRMAALKLKALDESELHPAPPPPVYTPPPTQSYTSVTYNNVSVGFIDINLGGFFVRVRVM